MYRFTQYFCMMVLVLSIFISNIALASSSIGKVIMSVGTVIADNGGETRKLKRGSSIYLGDAISTASKSKAHIRFSDKTLVELDPSTIFIVNKYIYDAKTPSRSIQESSLLKGGFRTITGLISKQDPKKYKVNTPVATIGVRSTIFSLLITGGILPEDMVLWLTVFQGTACASGNASSNFSSCFSSNSNTPNAKITQEGATGMSQIDLSDLQRTNDPWRNDNNEAFEQGDLKGLNQDFVNSFHSPVPGGAGGSDGIPSPGGDGFPLGEQ